MKALPLTCAIVSNHFYDLPVLASFVYSLLPHLVKSRSSSSLSEWRHHHLVSIRLLIAAGYGYHLGSALYLAFIMHLPFKRGVRIEHCQPFLHAPQTFLHDPPSAFTGDQVNPPEKKAKPLAGFLYGDIFFIIMIMCRHDAPCPLSFWSQPI